MSIDQEGRSRRLRELVNRLGDEDHIRRESANQTKREYSNIKQGSTNEFLKFIKMSEECEMNRGMLESLVYKDIAEEIDAALKKFEIVMKSSLKVYANNQKLVRE
ncbi:MAG TPA: hypothetical protein VFG77_04230 [Nitrososphaeraceae archaeon]|nr:hypothetical protein [Nitrososphaeraceae archaeon]